MGVKQLYNDNVRKLPNEYGDFSVMLFKLVHVLLFMNVNYYVRFLKILFNMH